MSSMTNLEMVQNILSSMDSDNVNSISDTEEAEQVLEVIKEVFDSILCRRKWTFLNKTRLLENASDVNKPTKLIIPSAVRRITRFKYKKLKEGTSPAEYNWSELQYLPPEDFLDVVQSRNATVLVADSEAVLVTNDHGVEMCILNGKEPTYWTSFDDKYIYLDAWVSSRGNTVTETNTSIRVQESIPFVTGDVGTQNIPEEMFPVLLAEAKSICWVNFKGAVNEKSEQTARRQYIKMREEEPTIKQSRQWVNYGKPMPGSGARRVFSNLS